MNDIYLSLEPIYEHFKKLHNELHLLRFILDYLNYASGCYCFAVGKITINTKNIIKHDINPCEPLDHETMHYILHKYFDMPTSRAWDNICDKILEYIWMEQYDR